MPKRKLQRFAENETFPHFFQPSLRDIYEGYEMKGRWNEKFFKNGNPIVVELGCGKGEFTVGLSRKYPMKNFIGIDLKGARMWRGAKTSHELKLPNVAFVRSHVERVGHVFEKDEVDEIWITFPDPQPNKPRIRKRLTAPNFLDYYRRVAKPGSLVHLKTDNSLFFEYTLQVIEEQQLPLDFHTWDVDKNPGSDDVVVIRTHYEEMFRQQGEKIKYLRFRLL